MDNWYQHAVTKQSEYGIIPQRQYDCMSSLVLLRNGLLISCLMVYSNESPCIIIWDTNLHTGERKQELKGGPHDVFSLGQLSNGQLASGSATLHYHECVLFCPQTCSIRLTRFELESHLR